MMGSPPKPSGGSRGFGGESRSSEMSELSPPGGSEGYGACNDVGAAFGRPRADEDIGPYGQQRPDIAAGAAPVSFRPAPA